MYACGTNFKLEAQEKEIDLIVIGRGRGRRTEMVIGECKGAGDIDERDVETLGRLCEHIARAAISCYPLFSKTSDDFSEAEIARFRVLTQRGIWPILFTARELEPYNLYERVPDDQKPPDRYPHNFNALARNSA